MKEFYRITENPKGYPSNFFVRCSENPSRELRKLGASRLVMAGIPQSRGRFAGIVLGETRALHSLQEKLESHGWSRRAWLSFMEK
jgi:hypothetical protein